MSNDLYMADFLAGRLAGQNGQPVTYEGVPIVRAVPAAPKKRKKRRSKSLRDIAAESVGLVKVRGALGGVYYE